MKTMIRIRLTKPTLLGGFSKLLSPRDKTIDETKYLKIRSPKQMVMSKLHCE